MTLFLETNLSKLYLSTPEERKTESVPEAAPEHDAASEYATQIADAIYGLCFKTSLREELGKSAARDAAQSQARLARLHDMYPVCLKDSSCLKDMVCSSSLTPAKFGGKRQDLVDCIKTTDYANPYAVLGCITKYTQNLGPDQREQVRWMIPRMISGQAVNIAMTPFAVLSQVIKVALKGLYLGGISLGCVEISRANSLGEFGALPHDSYKQCIKDVRDIFEGRDPQVNHWVSQNIPEWISTAAKYLAEGDACLKKFDDYMVEQYHTFPGIVHEGVHGMVGVAVPAAIGGGVRAAKSVLQVSANAARTAPSVMGSGFLGYFEPGVLNSSRAMRELDLIGKWTMSKPAVEAPISHTSKLFLSDYTVHTFKFMRTECSLLLKPYDKTLLYIHRDSFGSKILVSPYLSTPTKWMKAAVDQVFKYADVKGMDKVMLAWDRELFPLATYLEKEGIAVHRVGTLPTAGKNLTLVEVDFNL